MSTRQTPGRCFPNFASRVFPRSRGRKPQDVSRRSHRGTQVSDQNTGLLLEKGATDAASRCTQGHEARTPIRARQGEPAWNEATSEATSRGDRRPHREQGASTPTASRRRARGLSREGHLVRASRRFAIGHQSAQRVARLTSCTKEARRLGHRRPVEDEQGAARAGRRPQEGSVEPPSTIGRPCKSASDRHAAFRLRSHGGNEGTKVKPRRGDSPRVPA